MSPAEHAIYILLRAHDLEAHDPSPELRKRVTSEWASFREQAEALGFDAVEHRATTINSAEGDEWDHAAHDFILTRNHHGSGFWDGNWEPPWGDQLTALAHRFPPLEIYLGDDPDPLVYSL